jgi:hypothetical protein
MILTEHSVAMRFMRFNEVHRDPFGTRGPNWNLLQKGALLPRGGCGYLSA